MADQTCRFLAIVDCADIYDALCDCCSPAMMLRLSRTCRLARAATKDYMERAFDINRHLKRFFNYPFSFRVLQARTQAVVSGSSALQFMGRLYYPSSDLDIFVANRNAREVCDWVVYQGGKGYRFTPTAGQTAKGIVDVPTALEIHNHRDAWRDEPGGETHEWNFYSIQNKRAVLNFKSEDDELCVQVIVTHNTPMECILSFHSTVVMNLITYRAAYSLYPQATFEEGLMLPCDTRDVNHDPGLLKYTARGWKFAPENYVAPHLSDPKKHLFVLGKRCVGDESTWTIPLRDVSEVLKYARNNPLLVHTDPLSLNTFSLVRNIERQSFEMKFSVLADFYFYDRYTVCAEALRKIKFWLKIIATVEIFAPPGRNHMEWDVILQAWNEHLMQKCDCLPGDASRRYYVCPAFIRSFPELVPFAQCRLSL